MYLLHSRTSSKSASDRWRSRLQRSTSFGSLTAAINNSFTDGQTYKERHVQTYGRTDGSNNSVTDGRTDRYTNSVTEAIISPRMDELTQC